MSVSTDFIAHLNSLATITSLVGSRICQAPAHINEALPYIVLSRNGRSQDTDLSGTKDNDRTFLDVECRAATQDEAEQIGDALQDALHNYRGTWGSRRIQGVFLSDQSNEYEPLPAGSGEFEEIITTRVEIISE